MWRRGRTILCRASSPQPLVLTKTRSPVSAHCCLGPFWQGRFGRDRLTGFQASSRGGFVGLRVEGNRVLLRGQAVTVLRAELLC